MQYNEYNGALTSFSGRIYGKRGTKRIIKTIKEEKRVMALDVNAGHIDFAVMDKENFEVVSVGKAKEGKAG